MMTLGLDAETIKKMQVELDANILKQKRHLAGLLENLDPLEVMLRSLWYSRMLAISCSDSSNNDDGLIDELSYKNTNLVPEYLQSCMLYIASHGRTSREDDAASARLEETISCVESIISGLNQGLLARFSSIYILGQGAGLSDDATRYQVEAKCLQSIRGKRYQVINKDFFALMLCKQDDLIRRVYGIGYAEVVEGLISLMDSLTLGWAKAMQELAAQFDRYQEGTSISRDEAATISESAFGYRLNDVSAVTRWPEELISDLSLPVATASDFKTFESIDPLGLMPITKKPFIRVAGKSYCFCVANLLDNFYRSFYRAIRERFILEGVGRDSEFVTSWKERQALASEQGAADLIRTLLPNSIICANGLHPTEGTCWNKHDVQESDLVVLYEDVLLAIEVKAGAFCPTDPVADPAGHIKSFRALLEKASRQAESTIDYVRRCRGETCRFYDAKGHAKLEFPAAAVRTMFKICVTVDDFNEFASKADKLGFIEMSGDTIALSLDDLLVYSKYFDNPLLFLHFLTQRRSAASMPALYMNDELDHLGMYITESCYVDALGKQVEECAPDFQDDPRVHIMGFQGFREPIDSWFDGMYVGEAPPKPAQESPCLFDQVISLLDDAKLGYWRRAVASSLLSCGAEARKEFADGILARLDLGCLSDLRLEVRDCGSSDVPIEVFVDRSERPNDDEICRRKCLAALIHDGDPLVIRLDIHASGGRVVSLDIAAYKAEDLSEEDVGSSKEYVRDLEKTRKLCIERQVGRKVGRNEPCPCGSGKKYKKCCGR